MTELVLQLTNQDRLSTQERYSNFDFLAKMSQ